MKDHQHRYFILNKPVNMVSQFASPHAVRLLGDLDFEFPDGIHAVGRLDNHSEGLLILTTNKKITRLLFQGEIPHKRTYLVQVKNKVDNKSLEKLRTGISIRVKGGEQYISQATDISITEKPQGLGLTGFETAYGDHSWLLITFDRREISPGAKNGCGNRTPLQTPCKSVH